MTSRLKRSRARAIALAVGVGALGSLAAAPSALAIDLRKPPAVGNNCQADGKIDGRGSTFQTNEMNGALISGFNQDVCGKTVPTASNLQSGWASDPAGTTGMVAYNYTGAATGSGAGQLSQDCRTDEFGGSDLPYTNTTTVGPPSGGTFSVAGTLPGMKGTPGNLSSAEGKSTCTPTTLPPYPPVGNYPTPNINTGGSGSTDSAASVLNMPIGGGAVAFAVNLNGMCTAGTPTGINLTSDEFDKIMQGSINQWDNTELVATNPILTTDGCSGNIQRVVRFDNSGTTAISMYDLGGIDAATLCDGSSTWAGLVGNNPNTTWPLGCTDGTHTAPAPINAGSNGSPALISLLKTTNGGIGYAELGLWGSLPAGVSFVSLESRSATDSSGLGNTNPPAGSFISPGNTGSASNCNIGVAGLPGQGAANDAVGLNASNWASDITPSTSNHAIITYQGSKYPACGLTWDFVYAGINNETGETAPVSGASLTVNGPLRGMTNDQLETLYAFYSYVFSPAAQALLAGQTYDQLPATWLTVLRQGFQNNY